MRSGSAVKRHPGVQLEVAARPSPITAVDPSQPLTLFVDLDLGHDAFAFDNYRAVTVEKQMVDLRRLALVLEPKTVKDSYLWVFAKGALEVKSELGLGAVSSYAEGSGGGDSVQLFDDHAPGVQKNTRNAMCFPT